jgi:hypothetical protein
MAEGSIARPYRENPPEHLKEVHWAARVGTALDIVFTAHLTGPPITEPQDNRSQMRVSVSNLPGLARATLLVPFVREGIVVFVDQVNGSFPDSTGIIAGEYRLQMDPTGSIPAVTFILGGETHYSTSASGASRFGGANVVAVSVTLQVTSFYTGDWTAIASSSITPPQSLFGSIAGAATVRAELTLDPPSLAFG